MAVATCGCFFAITAWRADLLEYDGWGDDGLGDSLASPRRARAPRCACDGGGCFGCGLGGRGERAPPRDGAFAVEESGLLARDKGPAALEPGKSPPPPSRESRDGAGERADAAPAEVDERSPLRGALAPVEQPGSGSSGAV